MIKQTTTVICDKCGKELTDGKYYTISIKDHEISNRDDTLNIPGTPLYNCTPAVYIIPQPEKHFCADCISEIRKFVYG